MFRYNINGSLVTKWQPVKGYEANLVSLTDEQASNCIGFDEQGNPIFKDLIPDLKSLKKQLAKQKEQATIAAGFAFKTHTIDSNPDSQRFISSLLLAVKSNIINGFEGFTTKDNVDISLTNAEIEEMAGLCLAHVSNAHGVKRALYEQIDACNTLAELEAISI